MWKFVALLKNYRTDETQQIIQPMMSVPQGVKDDIDLQRKIAGTELNSCVADELDKLKSTGVLPFGANILIADT